MKKLLLIVVTIVYIGTHAAHAQAVMGGGVAGELTYCQKNLLATFEAKQRLMKTSEIEASSSIGMEVGYLFHHRLHPYLGAGLEYNFQESSFSYLIISGVETNSFAGGVKLLTGKEELGGEASGVLYPWQHHRLGIGFFIEAIPLFHATYTGGLKLCLRVHHKH